MYIEKELTGLIINCAIEVHKHLGPGLLESAYELLTYLKLSKLRVGLLINFNTAVLTQGIKRMVL